MILIAVGAALLVVAAVLYVLSSRNSGAARRFTATENLTVAQLRELHAQVAGEGLGGAFSQVVDVHGEVRCADPLHAPMSGRPCVWHRSQVIAQIEERRTTTDSQGHRSTRWERDDRTVSDATQGVDFELHDGAGITVAVHDAQIDRPLTVVDRFEPEDAPARGGPTLSIGPISFSSGPDQRLLGYRHVESVLPVGARVFVHGTATDAPGELAFSATGGNLLISTRSEDELVAAKLKSARWQLAGAGAAAAAGLVAVVIGAMTA
jgi:hypothetical protein